MIPDTDLLRSWLLVGLLPGTAGLLAGVLAGLFGIGGGVILVPLLVATLSLQGVAPVHVMHLAVGTSLAVIAPTAIRSFMAHRGHGAGNRQLLRAWVIPVPLGVTTAALIVNFISGETLKLMFAALAVPIALKMLFNRRGWIVGRALPGRRATRVAGFTIGLISAFMGIGGGILNTMFMTAFSQPLKEAVATSAGLGALIALPGALGYGIAGWGQAGLPPLSAGYVYLPALAIVAPFSILTAPVGARLAHRLPGRWLEIAFGVFLLGIAGVFCA